MSTRDESSGEAVLDPDRRDIPAHARAGPGDFAGLHVAALVRPEQRELVREALRDAASVQMARSVRELLAVAADVIVVDYKAISEASTEERSPLLAGWCRTLDPIRVVIDAPHRAWVGLHLAAGVDLAVEPGVDAVDLQARLCALLRRARLERDRNPLTGLPGNRWLRRQIAEMLRAGGKVGLLLLDIDDFKQYNDTHGHLCGDRAIESMAEVVAGASAAVDGSFAAHIGGDDFCIVCPAEALDDLATACLAAFVERSRTPEGGVGLSITAAGTIVAPAEVGSLEEAFARLARLKAEGKARPGTSYVRD